MADPTRCDAVLFDFFGTLVTYEPDVRRVPYPETHRLVQRWRPDLDHDGFVAQWDRAVAVLEREAAATLREYSILEATRAFATTCGLKLTDDQRQAVIGSFLGEWCRAVRAVDGVELLLRSLAETHRIGVVSNTHDSAMVPDLLNRFGLVEHCELIVLSVDHGYRKPHRSIYDVALNALDLRPTHVAFVGDSYEADYLGPRALGMPAFLIDSDARQPVPPAYRLDSVLDLADGLGASAG